MSSSITVCCVALRRSLSNPEALHFGGWQAPVNFQVPLVPTLTNAGVAVTLDMPSLLGRC